MQCIKIDDLMFTKFSFFKSQMQTSKLRIKKAIEYNVRDDQMLPFTVVNTHSSVHLAGSHS